MIRIDTLSNSCREAAIGSRSLQILCVFLLLSLTGCNTFGESPSFDERADAVDMGPSDEGATADAAANADASSGDSGDDGDAATRDMGGSEGIPGYETIIFWETRSEDDEIELPDVRVAVNSTATGPRWVALAHRIGEPGSQDSQLLAFDLESRLGGGWLRPEGKAADTIRSLQQGVTDESARMTVSSHDIMRAESGQLFHAATGRYRGMPADCDGTFPFAARIKLDPLDPANPTFPFGTANTECGSAVIDGDARLFLAPGGEPRLAGATTAGGGSFLAFTLAVDTFAPLLEDSYAIGGVFRERQLEIRAAPGGIFFPTRPSPEFEFWTGLTEAGQTVSGASEQARESFDTMDLAPNTFDIMTTPSDDKLVVGRGPGAALQLQRIDCSYETTLESGYRRVSSENCRASGPTSVPIDGRLERITGGGTERDYFVLMAQEGQLGDTLVLQTFSVDMLEPSVPFPLPLEESRLVQSVDLDVVEFDGRILLAMVAVSSPDNDLDRLRYDLWVYFLEPEL